ncbi:MAG: S28 family serine protease, partial [Bacteroidales bacterium]|nr:S28 family serine protease [Bacteroidales bacterium]
PIENIKVLEKEAFYSKIFEVSFTQAIDHNNPEMGSFGQRLYISHVDASLPVVLVTEGYTAGYYYTSEPAALLKCNQIISEHRYFGESSPDSIQWEYLTTWQSASDHHHIIEAFKEFYQSDWITTGISKGGQTVMYHSYYYPDDVKVRMPYVAPLNDNTEDQRIYSFLDHVGSSKCRRRIRKFQKNSLKKEEQLIPVFKDFCKRKEYTFELLGGIEKAFEYCVLEYSFAFWQWMYSPCSSIPGKRTKPEDIIIHMNMVAGFDYFADEFVEPYRPFFYQAYTEMGYYGYDLDKFKPWLNYATERGFEYTLPKNVDISFDKTISEGLNEYIKNEADNFIFIYGEYDTWSATAVELNQNENSVVFYKKKGSHRTRVRNMPEEQQEEVKAALDMYLSE